MAIQDVRIYSTGNAVPSRKLEDFYDTCAIRDFLVNDTSGDDVYNRTGDKVLKSWYSLSLEFSDQFSQVPINTTNIATNTSNISANTVSINNLTIRVDDLETTTANLTSTTNANSTNISTLTKNLGNLTTTVTDLGDDVSTNTTDISDLQTAVNLTSVVRYTYTADAVHNFSPEAKAVKIIAVGA